MGFHSVRFPVGISYGSQGGPSWNTSVIELASGAEERVSYWSRPRYVYDVSYGLKTIDDVYTLLAFFNARQGAAYGFRYKDWLDFTTASNGRSAPAATDVQIGTGDGATQAFQLAKTYTDAAATTTRVLEKPVSGTVVAALDGTPTTAFSVDHETGILTFTAAPGGSVVVTAGCEFDVPVRFSTGTERNLRAAYEAFDSGTVPSIELVELVSDAPWPEDAPMGGSTYRVLTGNVSLDLTARVWDLDTGGSVRQAVLPDPTYLPAGGPYWFVYNSGASNLQIVDNTATTLATLATTQSREIVLAVDASGDKVWKAL